MWIQSLFPGCVSACTRLEDVRSACLGAGGRDSARTVAAEAPTA